MSLRPPTENKNLEHTEYARDAEFHDNPAHPEIELLLCCARAQLDASNTARIEVLLQHPIDWEYLLQAALRHGLTPLLYWHLGNTCPDAVPPSVLDQLGHLFYVNSARCLILTNQLLRLLKLLEDHGIPAFPYKGPALAMAVYGDLTLRQFSDLDIVVRQQDALKARQLLISEGFRPHRPMTDAQAVARLRWGYAYHLVFDDDITLLDVHWRLTQISLSVPLDMERLWARLQPLPLTGTTVLNLSAEDLLLQLCVHGAKPWHYWRRLSWICDVAELVRSQQTLNWDEVMIQAGQLGCRRMLYLGLRLATDLLGANLPTEVRRSANNDRVAEFLAGHARRRLFSEASDSVKNVESQIFYIIMREHWRDRLPYLQHLTRRKLTPNEKDRALVPLPRFLSFLHYAARPVRLIRDYGLNLLGHLSFSFLRTDPPHRAGKK